MSERCKNFVVARPTLILDDIGVAEDRIRIPSVAAGVVDETLLVGRTTGSPTL
jgi:hypothetical protein